jgi:endonuclease/exonuclease/phosphatase family metal-dependent hydrolase
MRIIPPMTARLIPLSLICFLLGQPACRRERVMGPPRAVPVATDGRIDLRLMSFNVRYENDEDAGSRSWPQRLPGIVRMIRDESPDVIGVQEARHGQAADMWASLPDYEFIGQARDDGKRNGEYTGIFYRRDRFEPDSADQGTFWLSDTPQKPGSKSWGNEIPRTATWLRLTDRATRRGFYVFNTHWDHRHQGSRTPAARLIVQRIRERKEVDEPVVLLGDFNAIENNPAVKHLVSEAGLIDTFQALHAGEKNRRTLHFWSDTREGILKVDHILVSRGAKVANAAIRDRDKPMVSDHFPVTARVVFP